MNTLTLVIYLGLVLSFWVALTLTDPLSATDGAWFHRFATRHFEGTAFILAGIRHVGSVWTLCVFSRS